MLRNFIEIVRSWIRLLDRKYHHDCTQKSGHRQSLYCTLSSLCLAQKLAWPAAFVHKRTHSSETYRNHSSVCCSLKASPRNTVCTLYTKGRIILLWQIGRIILLWQIGRIILLWQISRYPRPWGRWCTSCRRSVCPSHTANTDRPSEWKDKRIFFHANNVIMAWMPSLKPSASSSLT